MMESRREENGFMVHDPRSVDDASAINYSVVGSIKEDPSSIESMSIESSVDPGSFVTLPLSTLSYVTPSAQSSLITEEGQ